MKGLTENKLSAEDERYKPGHHSSQGKDQNLDSYNMKFRH